MKLTDIAFLRTSYGVGYNLACEALEYANDDLTIAIAYIKAVTVAVATPNLTFDERVKSFIGK